MRAPVASSSDVEALLKSNELSYDRCVFFSGGGRGVTRCNLFSSPACYTEVLLTKAEALRSTSGSRGGALFRATSLHTLLKLANLAQATFCARLPFKIEPGSTRLSKTKASLENWIHYFSGSGIAKWDFDFVSVFTSGILLRLK